MRNGRITRFGRSFLFPRSGHANDVRKDAMPFKLLITTHFSNGNTTQTQYYSSKEDVIQAAENLVRQEDDRRRRDPKKGPAYTVKIECPDGTILDHSQIKREARYL